MRGGRSRTAGLLRCTGLHRVAGLLRGTGAPRGAALLRAAGLLRAAAAAGLGVVLAAAPAPANAASGRPVAAPSAVELAAFLDSLAAAHGAGRDIPGVSISLRVSGGPTPLALDRAWGFANLQTGAPATPGTVYLLGSTSKQFAAAAVLRLATQGRLSLDDPVTRHLPGLPAAWNAITLHHLLHQTSGICEFLKLPPPSPPADGRPESAADSLIALVARQPLGFAAGSRWSYSNSNYTLLARTIERITGLAYDEFLRRELLAPIGLEAIRHGLPEPASRAAEPYAPRAGGPVRIDQEDMNTARGDGGLFATAPELAEWGRALLEGRVLSDAEWTRLITPRPLDDGSTPPYACGVSRVAPDGRTRVAHDGAISGYTTLLALYPEEGLVIAVSTNRAGVPVNTIERAIARRVLGLPAPDHRRRPLEPGLLARLVGRWNMGVTGFPMELRADGDTLVLEVPRPAPGGPFRYVGDGRFVSESEPDEVQIHVPGWGNGPAREAARTTGATPNAGAALIDRLVYAMAGIHWDLRREAAGGK